MISSHVDDLVRVDVIEQVRRVRRQDDLGSFGRGIPQCIEHEPEGPGVKPFSISSITISGGLGLTSSNAKIVVMRRAPSDSPGAKPSAHARSPLRAPPRTLTSVDEAPLLSSGDGPTNRSARLLAQLLRANASAALGDWSAARWFR